MASQFFFLLIIDVGVSIASGLGFVNPFHL
jgi:hypothetical protein